MTPETSANLLENNEHDLALRDHVRPLGWSNPSTDKPYHLVILGGGPAGLVAAAGAARLGARVALIERDFLGGDCLNTGCVPSKCLVSSAEQVFASRPFDPQGKNTFSEASDHFKEVMQRLRRIRSQISQHDSANRFTELGVDIYFGKGSFQTKGLITVTGDDNNSRQLRYKRALIATGTRPSIPNITGIGSIHYLTHENLFSLTTLPRRFGIIGGGPIGCEMAQAFSRLGSEVFLFEKGPHLLPKEEREASAFLYRNFEKEGIRVMVNTKDLALNTQDTNDSIRIDYHDGSQKDSFLVDQLLVATGRTPNTDSLNLSAVGVQFDQGGVRVNPYLQTTNRHIYAAGDICSEHRFTHVADLQARAVIQNALFAIGPFGRKNIGRQPVPRTTYTSPEISHVGITREQAEQRGIEVDTYAQPFAAIDRAVIAGQADGFAQVHTRKGSDQILGATLVCPNAGDIISHFSLAMVDRQGLIKLGSTIHPYPTHTSAIGKLADQFQATRLGPRNQRVLRFLRWLNVGR